MTTRQDKIRGHRHWLEHHVHGVVIEGQSILATVSAERIYRVQLDMGATGLRSFCTCLAPEGPCEHAVAAYLAVMAAVGGRPNDFVIGMGSGLEGLPDDAEIPSVLVPAADGRTRPEPVGGGPKADGHTRSDPVGGGQEAEKAVDKPTRPRAKSREVPDVALGALPEPVAATAKQVVRRLQRVRRRAHPHAWAMEMWSVRDKALHDLERQPGDTALSQLAIHLCVIHAYTENIAWTHDELSGNAYLLSEGERFLRRAVNEFLQWFPGQRERWQEPLDAPEVWTDFVRSRCLQPHLLCADTVMVAQTVWDDLFLGHEALRKREIEHLMALRRFCPEDRVGPLNFMIAHLLVGDGKPEDALREVEGRPVTEAALLVNPMYAMLRGQRWEALLKWLLWAEDAVRNPWEREACVAPLWRVAADADEGIREAYEHRLRSDLVRNARAYRRYLLERERFEEWADLVVWKLADELYPSLERGEADVGRRAPMTIIPVYHHMIQRLVDQRHRDAYREAVRIMVRLQKLYQKVKRPDRWEAWLTRFVHRHHRLRALHEEMRYKGVLE
ncbi:SWIM zinc finger family protein [Alicyclobacillus sp.]|uniref:SWIM zinc finger family protein n=1 Tax=Alicyclobacillus sp. TaxID=61169 RepID=UPI0025C332F0|nr:SWIM zinc finger family protein [Alicyclobacillus sp.]MCL6517757.1 hypothetical protein [Alicyclobacillus sp.]